MTAAASSPDLRPRSLDMVYGTYLNAAGLDAGAGA